MKANVAALKQHLEQLFPGQWLAAGDRDKLLRTGIAEIDMSVAGGLSRRRISEWTGPPSSGKSTLLRGAVSYWCASGLNVVYVDTFSRLIAADWAFVEEGNSGPVGLNVMNEDLGSTGLRYQKHMDGNVARIGLGAASDNSAGGLMAGKRRGRFMVVRVSECLSGQDSRKSEGGRSSPAAFFRRLSDKDIKQEASWVVEQLIRSSIFDVVVLDLGGSRHLRDRDGARLQRALERSRAALIVMRDIEREWYEGSSSSRLASAPSVDTTGSGWSCHTRAGFKWSRRIHFEKGIYGTLLIMPEVETVIARYGIPSSAATDMQFRSSDSSEAPYRQTCKETRLIPHVQNRLFTHPQIPDRRTSKR